MFFIAYAMKKHIQHPGLESGAPSALKKTNQDHASKLKHLEITAEKPRNGEGVCGETSAALKRTPRQYTLQRPAMIKSQNRDSNGADSQAVHLTKARNDQESLMNYLLF